MSRKYFLIVFFLLISSKVFAEDWRVLITNLDPRPVTCVALIPTGPWVTKPVSKATILAPNAMWALTIHANCYQCMSPPGTVLCQDYTTGEYKAIMLFPYCRVDWHNNSFTNFWCPPTGL